MQADASDDAPSSARPRRRTFVGLAIGLGIAAVGLGVVVGVLALEPAPDPCADAELAIGEVWTPSTRTAFKALEPAAYFALEDWSLRWRAVDRRSCEATRIDGLADESTLAARRTCLARGLDELGAVLQRIQQPHARAWPALQLTALLGAPEACMAAATGAAPSAELAAARQRLFAAWIAAEVGELDQARAELDAARAHPGRNAESFAAELALAEGRVERLADQAGPARVALERAIAEASQAQTQAQSQAQTHAAGLLRIDAGLELAAVAVTLEHDAEAAKQALAQAQAILDAIESPGPRRARAQALAAKVSMLAGERAAARSELQAVLDSAQSAGVGAWERASWLRELAQIAGELGDDEAARQALIQARQLETGNLRAGEGEP